MTSRTDRIAVTDKPNIVLVFADNLGYGWALTATIATQCRRTVSVAGTAYLFMADSSP